MTDIVIHSFVHQ